MVIDPSTPCAFCAFQVRNLYAIARRVLERERQHATPEYEELAIALEACRPLYEAHHADQVHAFSPELEPWRTAHVEVDEQREVTVQDPRELAEERRRLEPLDARD
jgi:hypothetical protein